MTPFAITMLGLLAVLSVSAEPIGHVDCLEATGKPCPGDAYMPAGKLPCDGRLGGSCGPTQSPSPSPSPLPVLPSPFPSPPPAPTCEDAPSTSCEAFAKLEIIVLEGRCSGTASASCSTVTESTNDYQSSIKEWVANKDTLCDQGQASTTAKAVGTAMAKVWTEAAAKVTCTGQGFACGWAASSGKAWAIAFAEAIAKATAVADIGVSKGVCFSDIRGIGSVIATAASTAQADVCTGGGTKEDYEESLGEALGTIVADAFASATGSACLEEGAEAKTTCKGEAGSEAEGKPFEKGDACAGIEQVKACIGGGFEKCCPESFKKDKCKCKSAGCVGNPWMKLSERGEKTYRSFSDKSGNVCYCYEKSG